MDHSFVSASLGVKIADLKRMESQIHQLGTKNNQELIEFLNHLQLGGSGEVKDFERLLLMAEKNFFAEVFSLLDEENLHYLDFVFAEEILTFLNLKLNHVPFSEKFSKFDYTHLSLKELLSDDVEYHDERYATLLKSVKNFELKEPRQNEALLVGAYYDYLINTFGEHPFLLAKINAINTRTLYRAQRLELTEDDYARELIGDDTTREKFKSYFRLDQKQIATILKEKVDPRVGELFSHLHENKKQADNYFDLYIDSKVNDLVFSFEVVDLFIVYVHLAKRLIKHLKKVYYRVETNETNRLN